MKMHLPWYEEDDPRRKNKRTLSRIPSLWICPVCDSINAWNHDDAERATARLKKPVVVCHGSCFDNVCGHCHSDIVKPDSPILSECYTH